MLAVRLICVCARAGGILLGDGEEGVEGCEAAAAGRGGLTKRVIGRVGCGG